jgi:uncharacterized damage-inducible protein DinB
MEDRDYLSLLRHMEWADALTWRRVSTLGDAQQDQRLIDLLYHLHSVQWVYLQAWRGQSPHIPPRTTFSTLSAVAAWARPYYAELRVFIEAISVDKLSQPLAMPWAAEVAKRYGSAEPATLGEMVLQVVLHSTYHRAQVATRLRELGATPDVTDFIAWVWMNRPEPSW